MPIMCDGSNVSVSRGGIRRPVALVRIVNSRKIAVRPGIRLEPSSPNMTIMPATIPIRLMMTCTVTNVDKLIPRIMTRSRFLQTIAMLRPHTENCHMLPSCRKQFSPAASIKKSGGHAHVFCMAVTNSASSAAVPLAIEKLDQFRDHLVRRFFHQPMSAVLDEHALDVS